MALYVPVQLVEMFAYVMMFAGGLPPETGLWRNSNAQYSFSSLGR